MQNNGPEWAFPDFFAEGTARLSTAVKFARYLSFAWGNWDNYKPNDNIAARVQENNDEDMSRGPPNNLYKLYGI